MHLAEAQMAWILAVRAKAAEGRRTPRRCARFHAPVETPLHCCAMSKILKWDSCNWSLRLTDGLRHTPTA
jgi:hypothetical protein